MISRPRSRWLLERLAAFLLCLGIGAAYQLWKTLPSRHSPAADDSLATSPLDRRVAHLHLESASIVQVLDELSRQTGQKINVDWDQLASPWGDVRKIGVSIHIDNVSLASALRKSFSQAALTPLRFDVTGPDSIHVSPANGSTTSISGGPDCVVRDYDVSDLLGPFPSADDIVQPASSSVRSIFGNGPSSARRRALDELVSLMQEKIWSEEPEDSWSTNQLAIIPWADRLLVTATSYDQERISGFLEALRAAAKDPDDPPNPVGRR
jgi:hypothetical protein